MLKNAEKTVVAVKTSGENDSISQFKLNTGEILDYQQCLQAIRNNEVRGLVIGKTATKSEVIRSAKDETTANNLSNLPRF